MNADSNCVIEELELQDGHVTGFQLQHFISSSQPTLTHLRLLRVSGITNCELLVFLLHASSTLSYLSITDCTIPCDNAGDEYAIDASMSRMVCLTEALIEGPGLASDLAIKRKPHNIKEPELPTRKIMLRYALESDMGDIVGALETTTWTSVCLVDVKLAGWTSGLRERACNMARSRGISFASY